MIEQHRHDSLKNACRAAILHGNTHQDIDLGKWGVTFGCSTEHVKMLWEHELTKISRKPGNTCEAQDD